MVRSQNAAPPGQQSITLIAPTTLQPQISHHNHIKRIAYLSAYLYLLLHLILENHLWVSPLQYRRKKKSP